jgi:protein-disulfide isomerase-like protein with CxxC motif
VTIQATHFTDPGCPWAYSASPALAALQWRYGAQLEWRLVTIGLTEDAQQYLDRGYKPVRQSLGYMMFRDRFGMPFSTTPRSRVSATAPACRAIVATRLRAPELEYAAFRALQFGTFTDSVVFDEDADLVRALSRVDGLDARAIVEAIRSPEVTEAYEADRALARQAAGGPTEFQGKSAQTDGPVRYTAPSVIFETADGRSLEVGGFQPLEAYDVAIANLDVTLERTPAPSDPLAALERFPHGLTTQEVAAIMADGLDAADRTAAETALIELAAAGEATRIALGDDALWRARVFDTPGAAQATAAAAHAAAAHAAAAHAAAAHTAPA